MNIPIIAQGGKDRVTFCNSCKLYFDSDGKILKGSNEQIIAEVKVLLQKKEDLVSAKKLPPEYYISSKQKGRKRFFERTMSGIMKDLGLNEEEIKKVCKKKEN